MPLQVYATQADLSTWVDTEPINTTRYLQAASIVVARACQLNPYTAPDPAAVEPLKDATCAQVQAWTVLGVEPGSLGLANAPVKTTRILDATVERDTTGMAAALQEAANAIAPQAANILQLAGLLWVPVPVGADSNDTLPTWGQEAFPITVPWRDPLSGEYLYPHNWPGYE